MIRYKDLVVNAIMLVVDHYIFHETLHEMAREGLNVRVEVVARFSPYIWEHIKRFGEYFIDLETILPPLQLDMVFLAVTSGDIKAIRFTHITCFYVYNDGGCCQGGLRLTNG